MKIIFYTGKKFFIISITALTILCSVGVATLAPLAVQADDCQEYEAGTLVRSVLGTAVYIVTADQKAKYFPNSEVFHTWYEDFSGVNEVSANCFSWSTADPAGVNYRSGSMLIKRVESPSVYAVLPGNIRAKIASEAVASSLYGADWASLVRDIHAFHWANYTEGDEISTAIPHNGMLVKVVGSDTVYEVVDGDLQEVVGDLDDYIESDVRTLTQDVFDTLQDSDETQTPDDVVDDPSQGDAVDQDDISDEFLPQTPTLIAPALVDSGATFTISWNVLDDALFYELQESATAAFTSPTEQEFSNFPDLFSGSTTDSITATTYYRVRGVSNLGTGDWSNVVSTEITAETVPDVPTLTDPGTSVPAGTAFAVSWGAVTNVLEAGAYTLQEDTNSLFSSPATMIFADSVTSYAFTGYSPEDDTTYYYRIKANNDVGSSAWSSTVNIQVTGAVQMLSGVPDLNQPQGATNGVMGSLDNFCTPISAANVLKYWDDVENNLNANNLNNIIGGDYGASEYIGWFMNTNNVGSVDRDVSPMGTSVSNALSGVQDWIVWDSLQPTNFGFDAPALVAPAITKDSYVSWDITSDNYSDHTDGVAWENYKEEIDAGRPVVLIFDFWNPTQADYTLSDVTFYFWGVSVMDTSEVPGSPDGVEESWSYGDELELNYASGHSVTGVGYLSGYDIGDGNGTQDWVIVHDNWDTTAEDVAISWDNWMASIYLEPKANAAPAAPVVESSDDSIGAGDLLEVTWERVQGATIYCYEYATNPSFTGSIGICDAPGSDPIISSNPNPDVVTTYYYRVIAQNAYGQSGNSNVVSVEVTM